MSEFFNLLCDAVSNKSKDHDIAMLLSAGSDSLSTAIALNSLGKRVCAYTFELDGYASLEREKVESIAKHFGWPLKIIRVPTSNLASDFKRLAILHGCRKKVQFEVLFNFLYVVPEVVEREIWTGFNADDHYGNTRKVMLSQARLARAGVSPADRKIAFDEYRRSVYAESDRPESSHTWRFAREFSASLGKELLDPYLNEQIREYLLRFDHDQLSPLGKPMIRAALTAQLAELPVGSIARGIRLQIGGRVDELFRNLLDMPDINRFERRYSAVAPLCQRWGDEVASNPDVFQAELSGLPTPPRATVRLSGAAEYRPYTMAEVRGSGGAFKVISTFAGGGGSSLGYCLAGGRVLMANEFVPEAAKTYALNFPSCIIDRRDIREISGSDASVTSFLATVGLKPGELDVLDGSPPCCEYSTAGRGIGDQEVFRHYSDVKQSNIASLPFDLADLLHKAKAKVFICENVPAFATRGAEVFQRFMRALRFSASGTNRVYFAQSAVLTASDFGVPQKRQRLFIIGVRKDIAEVIGIRADDAVAGIFPSPIRPGVTIRSAFAGLEQTTDDIWPWMRAAMISPSLSRLIGLLPKNPDKPKRLAHIFKGYTRNYTLTRCSWEKPAPTMVVSGQRPDGLTGAIHPDQDRKFTIPELKRLTGLPDDFMLTGTLGQAAERICRMVPPLLTKAVAESVYTKVLLPYQEKTDDRV
jgi:DNA-cytosine methyltransferase